MSQVDLTDYYKATEETLPVVDELLATAKSQARDPVTKATLATLQQPEQDLARASMAAALAISPNDVQDPAVLHHFASHAREGIANILANLRGNNLRQGIDVKTMAAFRLIEMNIRIIIARARRILGKKHMQDV